MDEMIYVSPGKLEQFLAKPGRLALQSVEGGLKLPYLEVKASMGGGLDPRAGLYSKLNRAKKFLMNSGRAPYWFEDDAVRDGDWVQFEGELGFATVETPDGRFVLFAQPASTTGSATLLHGSAGNLVSPDAAGSGLAATDNMSSAEGAARLLSLMATERSPAPTSAEPSSWAFRGAQALLEQVWRTVISYPHVEGWARVTTVLTQPVAVRGAAQPCQKRILLGSPLYIRHFPRDAVT